MPKKNDPSAALLQSLKKVAPVSDEPATATDEESTISVMAEPEMPPQVEPSVTAEKPKKKKVAQGGGVQQKATLLLYQADLDVLNRITELLWKNGIRANVSECLRIAIRLASSNEEKIMSAYRKIRAEDGRVK